MAKRTPKAPKAPKAPTPSKAGAVKDKEATAPTFRVDLGESLPAQPDNLNPNRAK